MPALGGHQAFLAALVRPLSLLVPAVRSTVAVRQEQAFHVHLKKDRICETTLAGRALCGGGQTNKPYPLGCSATITEAA
jgi:hypothetical protein